MKKILAIALLLAMFVTLLAACGGGTLSGTYKDELTGTTSYTFKDGKVSASASDIELMSDMEFEVTDGKLLIAGAEVGTFDGSKLVIGGVTYKK
ncbi:MAG: hypothetical protein LBC65_01400 [Oscillospiraceae bacterium]|jgi:uncharacterized lipoprotein YehR (DUF1307 family)|nr:hypothetical protein [Oscillospiraceae bacterium]